MILFVVSVFITLVNALFHCILRLNRFRFRRGENVCVVLVTILIWVPMILVANAVVPHLGAMVAWMVVAIGNLWLYLTTIREIGVNRR